MSEQQRPAPSVLSSSAVMAAGTVVSRLSGFVRSTLLAAALGTTVADLLPDESPTETVPMLKDRARKLFDDFLATADRESLLMLCPLLARLGESPTRRR